MFGVCVRGHTRGTLAMDPISHHTSVGRLPGTGHLLSRIWSRVLDVGLMLWVLRIPLISVGLGLLMMLGVTQAQDTLVDIAMAEAPLSVRAGFSLAIAGLLAATFLLWAVPLHYAARLLLETDDGIAELRRRRDRAAVARHGAGARDRINAFLICQLPRLLGAFTFLVFAIGAEAAIANLPTLSDTGVTDAARDQLRLTTWVMLGAMPAFFIYAMLRNRIVAIPGLRSLDTALGDASAGLFRLLGIVPRAGDPDGELHATGRLLLLIYALGVILVLVASPLWLARQLPLALAVPLIFGGWVPIFSYLSSVGRRMRVPVTTLVLLASAAGVYLLGDNHDVRTLSAPQAATQRPDLEEAVRLWMRANGCAETPATCPRPIIVAAAGGASRAGFFTASVIGHFLDFAEHEKPFTLVRADGVPLERRAWDDARISPEAVERLRGVDIGNRLFAISGVSGGAYGAAVTAAALAARQRAEPPCAKGPRLYWFGGGVTTWQDCLESLTSGDYLTAGFFGLAFHDQVQAFLMDRAALLEQSWERRFADIVTPATSTGAGERLARPFIQGARDPGRWVPFLVLNGTSVETGQRIVTTDLKPSYAARRPCPSGGAPSDCPIFTHALDFHQLAGRASDLRLSTAALNSARFPVISPPGSIRQPDRGVADRIVDGGYFENFGAQSALELAQAMVDVAPALAPFILVIANDPQSSLADGPADRGRIVPDAADQVWLSELTGPLGAIGAVRSGRGRLAVAEAEAWETVQFGGRCGPGLAHIKVWPEAIRDGHCPLGEAPQPVRDISMSWWLSKPVQMNLREQLERWSQPAGTKRASNLCNNDEAVMAVWQALATPSIDCLTAAAAPQDAGGSPSQRQRP